MPGPEAVSVWGAGNILSRPAIEGFLKKLILLVLVAAGAWWYFIGSRKLTEDHINSLYQEMERATLAREPKALCDLLADDFQSTSKTSVGGRSVSTSENKDQTCQSYVSLYDSFEKIGDRMGGIVQLDSAYEIHEIQIAPDKKSARVDVSSSLDVAGTVMNIRSRSWDTVIRRNGKVLVLKSDGEGSIRSGG